MQIFISGSKSAPDMPLGFVCIQNFAGSGGEGRINLNKTFCYILMYGCDDLEWSLSHR